MKLSELINTCQNVWGQKGLFSRNPFFKARIIFRENHCKNKDEIDFYTLDANYYCDENYIEKYRERKIDWWCIDDISKITIQIKGKK